ncbi:MAG: carbon-nitrogen hydrolase family protein [Phycisphaeraceae bacterium]
MFYAVTFAVLLLVFTLLMAVSAGPVDGVAAGRVIEPELAPPRTYEPGPRKAVVGTSIFTMPRAFTTLEQRLAELGELIDEMAADAHARHGRGLDLAALTESAVTAGRRGSLVERALPLAGPVEAYFAAKAREHNTHLVVSFAMLEDAEQEIVSNVAVLFDRQGSVAGIYRKVFLVARPADDALEGGKQPGTRFPVFDLDFGRVGMQICYDMGYDDGFDALAAQGAELIIWPTASPQTVRPAARARIHELYIVSATRRNNASIIDPLGEVVAQVEPPGRVVTHELDLDYRIAHWQPGLNNGRALRRVFGDRVGFRYSEREDYGIFWSNDPATPIAAMLDEAGVMTDQAQRQRTRVMREAAVVDAEAVR